MILSKKYSIVILFVTFFLGYLLGKHLHAQKISLFTETRQNGQYRYINPLLECESSNFSENIALEPFKAQLSNLIDQLKSSKNISFASLYYRDLNNGPWIGINEKEYFSPASLVKVPTMITYFKAAEKDPTLLSKKIKFTSVSTESQSIVPELTLVSGQEYSVEELIERMIIYSDNQAYEILSQSVDNQLIINTYKDLGVDVSKAFTDPSGNILSVKSFATFFRILYNASYLNQDMSEKALYLLSQSKYHDALVRGINNPQITVAHKFGERTFENTNEKQLHDCGIVYYPQKPYLLCVMTKGKDFSQLSSAIAQISKLVYQSIDSR